MPGISPAKIAFHPSRNWASEMLDAERGAQAGKEFGVADLARLVAPIDFVAREIVPRDCAGSQPA